MDNQPITLPMGHILHGPERTYRIVKVLGRGGFGITYLAVANVRVGNINIEGKFAIKEHFVSAMCSRAGFTHTVEYSQPVANEVDRLRRAFLKEVERIHNLPINHPNVIKINEVFEENNTAYYVMEYLGDSHLQDFIKDNGPLRAEFLHLYLRPVAEAVAMLHQHNIAHYDIKPENIMMAPAEGTDPRPVLIDFGLAKHYNSQGGLTSFDGAAGYTPGYAPAEQYAGITEYSPAMDVYALGATAYYCLTGKTPPDAFRVKLNEIHAELNAIAGPQMANAIVHAMAMTPDNRIPDASAFLAEMGWNGQAPAVQPQPQINRQYNSAPTVGITSNGHPSNPVPPAPFAPSASSSRPVPPVPPPPTSNPQAPFGPTSNPQAPFGPTSNPLPPFASKPAKAKKGGGAMLWIILGIVGALAIAAVLYFFVFAGNEEYNSTETEEVIEETVVPESEDEGVPAEENNGGEQTAEEILSYTDDDGNTHEGYFDEQGEWVETNLIPAE